MIRRLLQLYVGLALYGTSMSMMVHAHLGLDPWDVFHQGLAHHLAIRFGTCTILVGALVLLAWIPLRQRPGLGTISNVVGIGIAVNLTMPVLPTPDSIPLRAVLLASGIVANAIATGLYIGAGLGPGPRDGLMTGWARRGHSLRAVRTCIELTVLAAGAALGGSIGVGTLAYALSIGPLAHVTIPFFARRAAESGIQVAGEPSVASSSLA